MPRVRVPSLVVTFPSTAAATSCEELCARQGLPGRMIPVPSQISAGCGLAWKVPVDARAQMSAALAAAQIPWEAMTVVELLEFTSG